MAPRPELYLFDSGTLRLGEVEVPVPFFLIRHAEGDVVVDGGNPLAVARDVHAHWGPLADQFRVSMSEDQHCAAQLGGLGVTLESVRYVVQTHLHLDHTGALGHFADAGVVVHERELATARAGDSPISGGYVRADYDRPEIEWKPVHGDIDLFSDGALSLIETPGHTAGHMSVLLRLPETGPVLLTADAADTRAQWEGRAQPRGHFSRDQAARSIARLRDLANRTGALVVVGHDADEWAKLRHAPECYR